MIRPVRLLAIVLIATTAQGTIHSDVADILDYCTAHLDRFDSWAIKCEVISAVQRDPQPDLSMVRHFDLRCDGQRASSERRLWATYNEASAEYERAEENCLRLLWDGQMYKKYTKGGTEDSGMAYLDDFASGSPDAKDYEVRSLRYAHEACYATGYCFNSFIRIDKLLREAETVSLRHSTEPVSGVACHVIDARTPYGDLSVWLDPKHGYAVAKHRIEAHRAAGHLQFGRLMRRENASESCEVTRFECIDGVWVGVEATRHRQYESRGDRFTEDARISITEFVLNPNHDELRSFEFDIPNGTLVFLVPITHIRYVWHDGELIKHVDDDVVARIDAILATMVEPDDDTASSETEAIAENIQVPVTEDTNDTSALARNTNPWLKPRAHCGLYCMYSLLRLAGRELDFRDLVVPEYFGRLLGSSMAELTQAAHDYGLHAGVAARLSTRALRQSPYQAILHIKADPEAKDYDHYTLYLGIEKGKARVFSPPEEPKLVDFADMAPLWDGYALFVSERPFDIDTLFQPDRQRLYFYGMSAVLLVLIAHVIRRFWLLWMPALSRRWALGLTVGQATALAVIALLVGGFCHFVRYDGLLANPVGVKGVQKAHAGAFIPKISAKKARELLGEDAVVIDARLTPDYERGHLEGAINLPVDANDAVWEATIPKIPHGRPIIAYCQSAACKFAEKISVRLLDEGFDDIAVFRGGWVEWEKKYGRAQVTGKEVKEDADHDPNV